MQYKLLLIFLFCFAFVGNAQSLKGKFVFSGDYESGDFIKAANLSNAISGRDRLVNAEYGNVSVGYFFTETFFARADYFRSRYEKNIFDTPSGIGLREQRMERGDYISLTLSKHLSTRRFRWNLNSKLIVGKAELERINSSTFEANKSRGLHGALYLGFGFRHILKNKQIFEYGLDFNLSEFGESSRQLRGMDLVNIYFKPYIFLNSKDEQDNTVYNYPIIPENRLYLSGEAGVKGELQVLFYSRFFSKKFRLGVGYSIINEFNQSMNNNHMSNRGFFILQSEFNFVNLEKECRTLPYLRLRYNVKLESVDIIHSLLTENNVQTMYLHAVHANKNIPLQIHYGLSFVRYYSNEIQQSVPLDAQQKVYRRMNIETGLEYYFNKNFSLTLEMSSLIFNIDNLPFSYRTVVPNSFSQLRLNVYLLNKREVKSSKNHPTH